MKKTGKGILALLFIVALIVSLSAPAFAVEPRTSTNGYSYTTVTYNDKPYTISLAIGTNSSNEVRAIAYCPIDGIKISINGVSAKFDTKYGGYVSATGSAGSGTTDGYSKVFNIYTPFLACPNASSYSVIRVYTASTSATFYRVNNGSNTGLSVSYKAS